MGPCSTLAMGKINVKLLAQIDSRESKKEIATALLTRVADEKLLLVALSKAGLMTRLFKRAEAGTVIVPAGRIVVVNNVGSIEAQALALASIKWHRKSARFLVLGDIDLSELSSALQGASTFEEVEVRLRQHTVLYIDPLDDVLEFYGDPSQKTLAEKLSG